MISFLHRLVECLGPHLLPQLPQVLTAVMPPDTDRTDLQDSFTLVHQLVTRYKAALRPLLLPVSPPPTFAAFFNLTAYLPAHFI